MRHDIDDVWKTAEEIQDEKIILAQNLSKKVSNSSNRDWILGAFINLFLKLDDEIARLDENVWMFENFLGKDRGTVSNSKFF